MEVKERENGTHINHRGVLLVWFSDDSFCPWFVEEAIMHERR